MHRFFVVFSLPIQLWLYYGALVCAFVHSFAPMVCVGDERHNPNPITVFRYYHHVIYTSFIFCTCGCAAIVMCAFCALFDLSPTLAGVADGTDVHEEGDVPVDHDGPCIPGAP